MTPRNLRAIALVAALSHAAALLGPNAPRGSIIPLRSVVPPEPDTLPFFASFVDAPPSPSVAATVTTRLPLGTILSGRDYVFSARRNVRGYEWGVREAGDLLDDFVDACAGPLRGEIRDYELGQIVLVPAEWDAASLGIGMRYDVYDGQQRIVTLCLLLAALRDTIELRESSGEVAEMLFPRRARKEDVVRAELRARDGGELRRILEGGKGDGDGVVSGAAGRRVTENYARLAAGVTALSSKERLTLLDYVCERVHLLVCIPDNASVARNIVMSQGKGMDNEPVDDFKGLVCFRYTSGEEKMYSTFDAWDELAGEPDPAAGRVGRKAVADACLLRAGAAMRTRVRRNDRVGAMERWLRTELATQTEWRGDDFFRIRVAPASRALYGLRSGDYRHFAFYSRGRGGGTAARVAARLDFLRGLAAASSTAKDAELAALDLLLRSEGAPGPGGQPLPLAKLDRYLEGLEVLTLWMAATKPPARERHRRVTALLDAVAKNAHDAAGFLSPGEREEVLGELRRPDLGASPAGRRIAGAVLGRLSAHLRLVGGDADFSANADAAPHVEHVLPVSATKKAWGEYWPDQRERLERCHGIGNLVLTARRPTAKEASAAFTDKRARLIEEGGRWPLTCTVAGREVWDKEAMAEHEGVVFDLLDSVWDM